MKHFYKVKLFTLTASIMLTMSAQAANDEHDMSKHNTGQAHETHDKSMKMDHSSEAMQNMFMEKRVIDGYNVSFHVMKATQSMQHGGSHNFMVKIEQDGKVVEGIKINSKVITPDGKPESKMLMKMGDWYMAGYDLVKDGHHQMMILFKTKDGKKHKGGVYYPQK